MIIKKHADRGLLYNSCTFLFFIFCLQSIMENVPSSSGHVGKYFLTKEFIPCKDLRLCRSHVHISQDPITRSKSAATFLQRVVGRFNAMDVNNRERIPKSLEARWILFKIECSLYQGYFVNMKAFKSRIKNMKTTCNTRPRLCTKRSGR